MKNIHVLPTDKPSRLWMTKLGNLTRCHNIKPIKEALGNNVNIYITSDEEIKVGDWFLPQGHINPHKLKEYNKINGDLESYNGLCYDISKCKKIILTTDQDLVKDNVQAIDDDFLEWFVNNPSCEEVEVENKRIVIDDVNYNFDVVDYKYKIIIPKEEAKQETLEQIDQNNPVTRGSTALVYKQETIEEAAEKEYPTIHEQYQYDAFIEGAKWQQERSYSEEDFKLFARTYYREIKTDKSNLLWVELADKCFEQFKKK